MNGGTSKHGGKGMSGGKGQARGAGGREKNAGRRAFLAGGIAIVHEDEDVLVIDKPPGILSARGEGVGPGAASVFDEVKRRVRESKKRRGTRAWIIHRLDKEASGLLVFAKSERAFHSLKAQFKDKGVHRLYVAVAEGEIRDSAASIRTLLVERVDGLVQSVAPGSALPPGAGEAKPAVTHYRVLAKGKGRTLVLVRLETGRKNQIRVHLQSLGHPIVGDRRYGAGGVGGSDDERVCLHAVELGFAHPATGKALKFRSKEPEKFWKLVGRRPEDSPRDLADQVATVDHTPARTLAPTPAPTLAPAVATKPDASLSWEHVAAWYEGLIEGRGSDHHERLIVPGTLRLLGAGRCTRVLDVACGEGVLGRALAALGGECVGVDASASLVKAAEKLAGPRERYVVGDARRLRELALGLFDAGACVMAIMNIDDPDAVLRGVSASLKPGGVFVCVMLHPAFRSPGRTSWEWEGETGRAGAEGTKKRTPAVVRQYRRVDAYLSEGSREVVMNPGGVSSGAAAIATTTHHRPMERYVRAFAGAGLLIDAMEEWPSGRTSQPGPRAEEENRARREIPMFLAIRGVKNIRPASQVERASSPPDG